MDEGTIDWHRHYEFSAPAWERWADALAGQQEKINAALLDEADVEPGQTVLDLASGVGEPALQIARRVGASGRVVATDVSERMLDTLRRRADAAGLGNVATRLTPMERLPFGDQSFDAVVCRYGVMYSTDPAAALAECLRVLKPGSRVAMMVWGPEALNSTIYVGCRALQAAFPDRITEAEMTAPLRFAEPGTLSSLLEAAGAQGVRDRETTLSPRIRRGTPFWRPLVEMNMGEVWSGLTDTERAEAARAIDDALAGHVDGEHYRLSTSIRIVSGQRAG
jgi:SAM-dependent methyltransferase